MSVKAPKLADDQFVSPAEIVGSIDDLLIEILLRLPVPSVHRSRLVSKQWNSIISSREFWSMLVTYPTGLYIPWTRSSSAQKRFSRGVDCLSFCADKSSIPTLGRHTNILQSCNGLLLCSKTVKLNTNHCSHYYVYNPTTENCFTFPELVPEALDLSVHIYSAVHNYSSVSLAFDPRISPHYKVVCAHYYSYALQKTGKTCRGSSGFYTYSSDTGVWTLCTKLITKHWLQPSGSGVYWNGAIHWINQRSYFNIEEQTYKAMPVPPTGWLAQQNCSLCESYGHLYYTAEILRKKTVHRVYVFELRSDYSEWFPKYVIDLQDQLSIKSVISVVCGKTEDDSFLVFLSEGKALRYNLASRTFDKQELHDFEGASCTRAFQYTKCLAVV